MWDRNSDVGCEEFCGIVNFRCYLVVMWVIVVVEVIVVVLQL